MSHIGWMKQQVLGLGWDYLDCMKNLNLGLLYYSVTSKKLDLALCFWITVDLVRNCKPTFTLKWTIYFNGCLQEFILDQQFESHHFNTFLKYIKYLFHSPRNISSESTWERSLDLLFDIVVCLSIRNFRLQIFILFFISLNCI